MDRWGRWVVGLVLAAVVPLVLGACGSSGHAEQLDSGIEELASVGGPDGSRFSGVEVVGCGDDAEVPAGYAHYDRDQPDDPSNEELVEITEWYQPKWEALGWQADPAMPGSATRTIDGADLRAMIEVGNRNTKGPGTGYSIVVTEDGAGLCT